MKKIKDKPDYRTVWISDIHLGSKASRTKELFKFLKKIKTERLFLNGDIIDGWVLQKKWTWNKGHTKVLRRIIKISKKIETIYISGNHDDFIRKVLPLSLDTIKMVNRYDYQLVNGKRALIIHGDVFDNVVKYHRWLSLFGAYLYEKSIYLNRVINRVRKLLGKNHWSFSNYLKMKVKQASSFIEKYEHTLVDYAKKHGFEAVITGHIHFPSIKEIDGVLYCNDGDWVENCSALVEHHSGKLEIIKIELMHD